MEVWNGNLLAYCTRVEQAGCGKLTIGGRLNVALGVAAVEGAVGVVVLVVPHAGGPLSLPQTMRGCELSTIEQRRQGDMQAQ